MIKNKYELIGFITLISEYTSQNTNEIQLGQKDLMNITGWGRKKLFESLTTLKDLKLILSKYDNEDNRKQKYFIHPYLYFQGQLNVSVISYLFGITKELNEPFQYVIIKDNEVKASMLNDILETQERYVYFIENTINKEIKIGVTSNIERRMNKISIDMKAPVKLLKLIEGNESTEKELHNKFSQYRLHGEWFEPSKELITYINQL